MPRRIGAFRSMKRPLLRGPAAGLGQAEGGGGQAGPEGGGQGDGIGEAPLSGVDDDGSVEVVEEVVDADRLGAIDVLLEREAADAAGGRVAEEDGRVGV